MDFLRGNRVFIDFGNKTISFPSASIPITAIQQSPTQEVPLATSESSTSNFELEKLLKQFPAIFDSSSSTLGRTNIIQHSINTGEHQPIHQAVRRIPIHYQASLDQMIQDMLKKEIIRPSISPWSSPIVLVKKKDGNLRLCVDYRKLNAITKKDSFPLPRIDTTFDALSGAKWFSTLDLASGYWQVEMHPADREKTAFTVPSGLYEFETMPFGLSNAPATFQRLMQIVLQGLTPERCLIYLDDVIVHGKTIAEHNSNLHQVFSRLHNAGLQLRAEKCQFLKNEVEFLGHRITPNGIHTDNTKIEKVAAWPTPQNVTEVRSFLGLATYYRRFIRDFANIAGPLHRLTEKGRKFLWSVECDQAFQTLKNKLTSSPVLVLPHFSPDAHPFILDTDASATSIGAVLSQKDNTGVERVIAYASRVLDKRERRYCTTRREMLALVYFVRHFRAYLLGKSFVVRTDHQSLKWLKNFREPEGQIARWQERLQEYDFICEYRPGQKHNNADAMSRLPDREIISALFINPDEATWSTAQAADPDIAPCYNRQLSGATKPSAREMTDKSVTTRCLWNQWDKLRLVNDVLYMIDPTTSNCRLVVPTSKKHDIINQVHEQLGHSGSRKTETALRQRYWWALMHSDVAQFCSNCSLCAQIKPLAYTPRAPLQPMMVETPNQRVGVDIIGPLPISKKGNRYILVMVDYFTKWCEAVPLSQQDAQSIATAFFNEWISRYGAPRELHSDQGAAFESALLGELCYLMRINKTRTTPYHPQGNGLVERTNRTIKAILRSFVDQGKTERWDEYLPNCLLAYRASVHSTTGFSPATLLFGYEMRLPVEIQQPLLPVEVADIPDHLRNLRQRLESAYRITRKNLLHSHQHQKEVYDRKLKGPQFSVGDYVWLHRPRPTIGMSTKFCRPWKGPYVIVYIRSPTTIVLRDPAKPNADVLTVHYNQLKPCTTFNSNLPPTVPTASVPIVESEVEIPAGGGVGQPISTADSALVA